MIALPLLLPLARKAAALLLAAALGFGLGFASRGKAVESFKTALAAERTLRLANDAAIRRLKSEEEARAAAAKAAIKAAREQAEHLRVNSLRVLSLTPDPNGNYCEQARLLIDREVAQ